MRHDVHRKFVSIVIVGVRNRLIGTLRLLPSSKAQTIPEIQDQKSKIDRTGQKFERLYAVEQPTES
ncbi:hypothetical protein AA12717_2072 [Gluconacetobacter sacchari DSM 12717]|uniref:Transposase n=1 Tax=Gluconacetobacter sacchari DSM 12717 TaxID=1307940 RepID=A0ABQ0P7J9_9PROT|nr:hypothetical protein AA12717_2072 [Gluconacetobacter sacchari DSM 12717]